MEGSMLNWLKTRRNPVEDDEQIWVDERFDVLTNWLTPERVQNATVIEPNDRFFPGEYDGSVDSVQRHVERLISHLAKNLEPFEGTGIQFSFENLRIDPSIVEQPIVLTAAVILQFSAQAVQTGFTSSQAFCDWTSPNPVGHVTDIEETLTADVYTSDAIKLATQDSPADHARRLNEELAPTASILSVLIGGGLFVSNTAVLDSVCGCSGGSCGTGGGQSGAGLSFPQFGWALARFASLRDEPNPPWASHLRLDVKSPFRQAQRLLQRRAA